MKRFLKNLGGLSFWIVLGSVLFIWGRNDDGFWRILFGLFFLTLAFAGFVHQLKHFLALKRWMRNNRGKKVLFYASQKDIQKRIEKEFIPRLSSGILKVYYDGPKIIGDIKRSIVIELMNQYKEIRPNHSTIIEIEEKELKFYSLQDEMDQYK